MAAAAAALTHKLVLLTEGTVVGGAFFSLLALVASTKLALERSLTTAFFYAKHPQLLQQLLSDHSILRLLLGAPSADAEQHLLILHHYRTGRMQVLAATRAAEEFRGSPFVEYFSRGTVASFNNPEDDVWEEDDMERKREEEEEELEYAARAPSCPPGHGSTAASALESAPSVEALTPADKLAVADDIRSATGCASAQETKNFFSKLPPEFAELFHEATSYSEDPLTAHMQESLSEETADKSVQLNPCRSTETLSLDHRDETLQIHDVPGHNVTRFSFVSTLPRSPPKTSLNELRVGGTNEEISSDSYLGRAQDAYVDSTPTTMKGQFFKQQLQILVDLLLEVEQNAEVFPDDRDRP